MSSGIVLKGFDELLAATEELGRKGGRIENEALRLAGDFIVGKGREGAPVRTRKLKDSIQRSNVKTSKGVKRIEIGSDQYYFRFVEEGTSKMAANPFLSRAFEQNKVTAYKILEKQLKIGLGLL